MKNYLKHIIKKIFGTSKSPDKGNHLEEIVKRFLGRDKHIKSIRPFGSGHINDTYKVETSGGNFILQRINHKIFKDIEGLSWNIMLINEYINRNEQNFDLKIPEFYSCCGDYYTGWQGNYWRLMSFIEDSKSYDLVPNEAIALEGGKAYGKFVKILSGFPVNDLKETIPQFHDIDFRLKNFEDAVDKDIAGRVKQTQAEIDFIRQRASKMYSILQLGIAGKIPVRVTHNDTKINNVLFNRNDKAIAVIDLDTVMPGYVHYDFGDAIRTFTNTANEDEPDLSKVGINMEYFKAFARGFLSETKDILTPAEKNHLAFSAQLMTYIIGMRFFTDYLSGDTYFKTAYPEHNLVRARAQFKLLESMEMHYDEMKDFIKRL